MSQAERPYVVIAGSGRSGTNRIMDAFDLHERTICRSEPEEMVGGDFAVLPRAMLPEDLGPEFESCWRDVVHRARRRQSDRDRIDHIRKTYYQSRFSALVIQSILSRRRARRALGLIAPSFRTQEWPRPMSVTDAGELETALLVLKTRPPEWILRTHAVDRDQKVIHKIRNPLGYLNSWYNRYVIKKPGQAQAVFRESMQNVPYILKFFGEDKDRIGSFSERALIESELWIWRFLNEKIFSTLRNSSRYRLIRYEEFEKQPVDSMKNLVEFCGLEPDDGFLGHFAIMENTLFGQSHVEKIDADLVKQSARRVLMRSPLLEIVDI